MNLEIVRSAKESEVIQRTEEFVRETLKADSTGHDWWHINRVRNVAVRLAKSEGADQYVVELAALLHDIACLLYTSFNINNFLQSVAPVTEGRCV